MSEPEECAICLDSIRVQGIIDSCKHDFCYDCILKWSSSSNTCPLCKKRFHSVTKKEVPVGKSKKRPHEGEMKAKKKRKLSGSQKPEVTQVPFRDLKETQSVPSTFETLRQIMMTQHFMETLRQFVFRREFREVDGVIDLTEELEPRSPPQHRVFRPVRPVNNNEPIDITDDDDVIPVYTPRPQPQQPHETIVIDLIE